MSIGRPRTGAHIVALIRRLAESYADHEIAECLNEGGFRTRDGNQFTKLSVRQFRYRYHIAAFQKPSVTTGQDMVGDKRCEQPQDC
jgi:hypothetical protein